MTDKFFARSVSYLIITVVLVYGSPAFGDMIVGTGVFNDSAIPNGDGESTFSTITITDAGIIEDISVTIQSIDHGIVGELTAELRFLGNGGPSDPGGDPAYLFFRPNFDGVGVGSTARLLGDYTFTSDETDTRFWDETGNTPPGEIVDPTLNYFASDTNGNFNDLGGPEFFQGFNAQGQWQLIITDVLQDGAVGTVQGWSIEFHVQQVPEPCAAVFLGLVSWAAITRRKR